MGKRKNTRQKNQKYPRITNKPQVATSIPPCSGKREGSLCFEPSTGGLIEKYDAWIFVKNDKNNQHLGFNGIKERGIRSVDFCVIDTESNLWLVEVKDYRKSTKEYEEGFFTLICQYCPPKLPVASTCCNNMCFSASALAAL